MPPDENDIIKKAIEGDRESFSTLLDSYYEIIFKIAYKWCGNREDAEDIAQDSCIKIAKSISNFKMEAKFSSWVYRIVINTANDFYRKKKEYLSNIDMENIESGDNSANDVIAAKELWQMVHTLPEKQRDSVLLVYCEEMSHLEAAEVLQCAESTISWHIMEAKKQLKGMIT